MRRITKTLAGAALAGGVVLAAPAAAGASGQAPLGPGYPAGPPGGVVFVQTDNTSGNQVVVYDRAGDGTLDNAVAYDTGGLGGALKGSVVDHLASQGSLVLDWANGALYALNAGSNTISVFDVHGDRLSLRQVLPSNGTFPVSIAVHGDLVYVLNALGGGSLARYRAAAGTLRPIPGSVRSLGLTTPTNTTQFTHTPGQVAFSPDGSKLIVTTKAAATSIDVFGVGRGGQLSATPTVNSEPTTVPFAVTFDFAGNLIVTNAGPDSVSAFTLNRDGTLTEIDTVATGQKATCWITSDRGLFYASNAASGSLTTVSDQPPGQLGVVATTSTDPGTVDATVSGDQRFLYVQTGLSGIVDEFRVGANGALFEIGSVTVPGAVGGEGIAAS